MEEIEMFMYIMVIIGLTVFAIAMAIKETIDYREDQRRLFEFLEQKGETELIEVLKRAKKIN
jgi:hypothetical protein